jgi:hypothetical protein
MCQATNVRTARGSFEVRTANPKRFESLASRYVSNSRYLLFRDNNYYYEAHTLRLLLLRLTLCGESARKSVSILCVFPSHKSTDLHVQICPGRVARSLPLGFHRCYRVTHDRDDRDDGMTASRSGLQIWR